MTYRDKRKEEKKRKAKNKEKADGKGEWCRPTQKEINVCKCQPAGRNHNIVLEDPSRPQCPPPPGTP